MKKIIGLLFIATGISSSGLLQKRVLCSERTGASTGIYVQQNIPVAINKNDLHQTDNRIDIADYECIYSAGIPVVWNY